MKMAYAALCAALFVVGAAGSKYTLRSSAAGFVQALEFKHTLRVCNAYPFASGLDLFRGKGEKLTAEGSMPYKGCQEFSAPMKSGDKLEFKVGDETAGTFAVSDLPNNDAVLLLVIHRHDTLSTAVSFESHVFSNLQNAQVAILDAYKGAAKSMPRIMDHAHKNSSRSEELRFDSVVAVSQGMYDVVLQGQDGETKAENEFVALNHESYVILRTGLEAQNGPSFPQELVVFPQSDPSALPKSAAQAVAPVAVLAAALVVLATPW